MYPNRGFGGSNTNFFTGEHSEDESLHPYGGLTDGRLAGFESFDSFRRSRQLNLPTPADYPTPSSSNFAPQAHNSSDYLNHQAAGYYPSDHLNPPVTGYATQPSYATPHLVYNPAYNLNHSESVYGSSSGHALNGLPHEHDGSNVHEYGSATGTERLTVGGLLNQQISLNHQDSQSATDGYQNGEECLMTNADPVSDYSDQGVFLRSNGLSINTTSLPFAPPAPSSIPVPPQVPQIPSQTQQVPTVRASPTRGRLHCPRCHRVFTSHRYFRPHYRKQHLQGAGRYHCPIEGCRNNGQNGWKSWSACKQHILSTHRRWGQHRQPSRG